MENAPLSAEYSEHIKQRRKELRDTCARLLAEKPPFVWEAGSGHGHFLTAYAAAHPGELCVGVDMILERIARAERKRVRSRLENLHFLRAEVADFLAVLPDESRFAAIYILFPDPWPKRRHHKNRLLQPDFVAEVAARAAPGARLYFRTDYEPYFAAARALLEGHPAWRLSADPWPFEAETVFEARANGHHSLLAVRAGEKPA